MDQTKTLEIAFSIISVLLLFLTSTLGWIANNKLSDIRKEFDGVNATIKTLESANSKNTLAIATITEHISAIREKLAALDRGLDKALSSISAELRDRAKLEARLEIALQYSEQIPELKRDLDNLFKRVRDFETHTTM